MLLFDGNALVHRAFHALPPLSVPGTGEMVNAVYGFASTLLKVLAEIKPAYWAVAFDRPAPTFRHKIFPEYKAQRPTAPQELKSQIGRVHQLVEVFHIPIFEIDGFEADDILGTLSKQAGGHGIETIIVTGDNDMLQLVMPGVTVMAPRRTFGDTVFYDEEAVKQKYGIKSEQVTDFKALVGDVSDNIPGVPGVGEKTAIRLIQQYGGLEEIYEHIEDVTPDKLRKELYQYKTRAFQGKELVTIVMDVPIELGLESCRVGHYDRDEVVELFRELGFIKLVPRLPQEIGGTSPSPAALHGGGYQVVDTEESLNGLVSRLERASEIVMDIETTGKGAQAAEMGGMALSPAEGEVFYIPMRLPLGVYPEQQVIFRCAPNEAEFHKPERSEGYENDIRKRLSLTRVAAELKPILESVGIGKIAYDGKRNMTVLANCGVTLEGVDFDVLIAAYLLGEKNLSLKALAFKELGVEIKSLGDLLGTGKKQVSLAMLKVKQVADYASSNISSIRGLKDSLERELHGQGLWQLFSEMEMPLIPVLADMESNGIALDTGLLRKMSLELGKEMIKLELEIYNSVGHQFNVNSPRQLGNVLFEELGLPRSHKTKSGYSTGAPVLEALRGVHPVIEPVLEYRQLAKLKSTYVDALPALINPRTGRVHTTFNQAGTTTGRLSSSEPNLQNIPIRGKLGNKIRQAIIAPPGAYLLSADYSQIDLRALAHLSQDVGLISAFARDEDVHATTASNLFGVPAVEVTPEMRRIAKTVNFGVIYGMSDYGLEQATELSREEAAQFIALYFERYPEVKEYIETTKEQARKLGYVQTVLGRRRLISEINSYNKQVREAAERMAINAPVQGTSADIIKIAMLDVYREMKKRDLESKMLLQIHDELLFEVPEEEIEEMRSLVSEMMPGAMKLSVPLKIDIKLGKNWGEMTFINIKY